MMNFFKKRPKEEHPLVSEVRKIDKKARLLLIEKIEKNLYIDKDVEELIRINRDYVEGRTGIETLRLARPLVRKCALNAMMRREKLEFINPLYIIMMDFCSSDRNLHDWLIFSGLWDGFKPPTRKRWWEVWK